MEGEAGEHEQAEHESEHGEEAKLNPDEPMFWIYLGIAFFLVTFAGVCSGLTVGYLGIDDLELDIMINGDTADEAKKTAALAI